MKKERDIYMFAQNLIYPHKEDDYFGPDELEMCTIYIVNGICLLTGKRTFADITDFLSKNSVGTILKLMKSKKSKDILKIADNIESEGIEIEFLDKYIPKLIKERIAAVTNDLQAY